MRTRRTWEEKFGYATLAWILLVTAFICVHWWQESLGEGNGLIWSCHTMGSRECGPGTPWHGIIWTGGDD